MCGVVFALGSDLPRIFKQQSDRGLDGIGVCFDDGRIATVHLDEEDETTKVKHTHMKQEERYAKLLTDAIKKRDSKDRMVLMHHRKASIGIKAIDNVHPFKGERFILAQNGTDKHMRFWGTLAFIPEHYTDSYCLLKYLEHTCNKLELIPEMLDFLVANKVVIGVVWIVDYEREIALVYSDGARSLFVDQDDTSIAFQSLEGGDEFDTVGHAIFDLEGNLLESHWTKLNVPKVVYKPITHWPYETHTRYGSQQTLPPKTQTQPAVQVKVNPNAPMLNRDLMRVLEDAPNGSDILMEFMVSSWDPVTNKLIKIENTDRTALCTKIDGVIYSDDEKFTKKFEGGYCLIIEANMQYIRRVEVIPQEDIPDLTIADWQAAADAMESKRDIIDDDYYSTLFPHHAI